MNRNRTNNPYSSNRRGNYGNNRNIFRNNYRNDYRNFNRNNFDDENWRDMDAFANGNENLSFLGETKLRF